MRRGCYLCGNTDKKQTVEHVPPQGLFLGPLPSEIIKIDCCEPCRRKTNKHDEHFMYVVSAAGTNQAGREIFKKFLRGSWKTKTIQKTLAIRSVKDQGEMKQVGTHSMPDNVGDELLTRITKGLLYQHHPNYEYKADEFQIRYIVPIQHNIDQLGPHFSLPRRSIGEGVFTYWGDTTVEKNAGMWLFLFFESVLFRVVHARPGLLPPQKL